MIESMTPGDLLRDESWRELERQLRPFVGSRVPASDVDDVLQEVLLAIQRGLPSLRSGERLGPWVYRIARNGVVDHHRRRGRTRPPDTMLAEAAHPHAVLPAEQEEVSASAEAAAYAAFFVSLLREPYREALSLTELQGLTQREAAERAGVSLSTMKSRVQRGRRQLRSSLEDCCDFALDARQRVIAVEPRVDGKLPRDCCE